MRAFTVSSKNIVRDEGMRKQYGALRNMKDMATELGRRRMKENPFFPLSARPTIHITW